MNRSHGTKSPKLLSDEYGNLHELADEIARGGQGVVFRTKDADLAIKQPLGASGQPDKDANLRDRFQNIRLLPIPHCIPVSLPLANLRDEAGYVMRLLSGMTPFSAFDLDSRSMKELKEQNAPVPHWLESVPDKEMAFRLAHFASTGSIRRRLLALSKCASILARLHSAGLVYGDISANNAFIGEGACSEVWLIDADNLRFELPSGGTSVYTPGYGAPEVVREIDCSRPRSDCWAFAVMAFRTLALCHPFIGKQVLEPDTEVGWDTDLVVDGAPADLDERAYAGYFPYIDDDNDGSNRGSCGLPRELVATPGIRLLFQETFGVGRKEPHRRPMMFFWALELTKAFDRSLDCRECKMSYFVDGNKLCPYCGTPRPAFIRAKTTRWEAVIPEGATEFELPHRLFHPFSFEHNNDTEYEVVSDFAARMASPVRGTRAFPDGVTFDFVEAEQ